MKRILGLYLAGLVAVFAAAAAWPAPASADAAKSEAAAAFIRDLGNKAIGQLGDTDIPYDKRVAHFRALVDNGFAMDAISRFVLGRYWRVASSQEQQEFRETFLDVITQRFLPLFEGYTKDDFSVEGARPDPRNPQLYLVNTRIAQPSGDGTVKAGWRVREKGGDMEIVDVVAEGVSMAITLRSEYGSVIKRNGGRVSALIAMLRENVEKGAYAPDSVEEAVQ